MGQLVAFASDPAAWARPATVHSRHGGEKHRLSLQPQSPSIKHSPLYTSLIAPSFFHTAGQFASPCLKGYLHPAPLIPTSSKTCDAPSPLQFQMLPSRYFSATSAPALSFWRLSAIFSPLQESVQVPTMPHVSQQESVQLNLMTFHRADQRVVVVFSVFHDPSQNYREGLSEVTWLQSKTPVNLSPFSSCLLVI